MPKIPLNIELSDTKLSQIKSWHVPSDTTPINTPGKVFSLDRSNASPNLHYFKRNKRSKSNEKDKAKDKASSQYSGSCTARYQQTLVRVFAEFIAEDPDSGRKEYFPSRGTQLDVTELLEKRSLRISNNRIATLKGDIVQGRSPGKTEIKVQIQIICRY